MSKTVNAGIVTAYGAAVRGGYEGTYTQFCADLGKLADVLSELLGFSVSIETLAEGEQATANYDGGILSLGIPRGNTGNGIQSIVLNADYTLTVTYTNGNHWTSGSIRGQVGATPHLTIGTVQTLEPGQSATASITGTDEDPVLNLGIPKGQAGASDAGGVSYDPEGSYNEGTVGAELQEQNRQLSDVESATDDRLSVTESAIFEINDLTPAATASGWKLLDNGLCVKDESYSLIKYVIKTGQLLKISTDDKWQFQNSSVVPASGSNNRVGTTHASGVETAAVPTGATWLIVSAITGNADASVSTYAPIIGEISEKTDYVGDFEKVSAAKAQAGYKFNANGTITTQSGFDIYRYQVKPGTRYLINAVENANALLYYTIQNTSGLSASDTSRVLYRSTSPGWQIVIPPENGTYLFYNAATSDTASGVYASKTIDTLEQLAEQYSQAEIISNNADVLPAVNAASYYGVNKNGVANFKKQYAILVTTDIHGFADRMNAAIDFLNGTQSIDAGICLGDMAAGYFTDPYEWYITAVDRSVKNWYTVIGNHDGGNGTLASQNATKEQVFSRWIESTRDKMGLSSLATTYYTFSTDTGVTFIVLDCYDMPDTLDGSGNFVVSRGVVSYSQNQIDWLISTLASVPANNSVVVITHTLSDPMTPDAGAWTQPNAAYSTEPNYHDLIPDIVNAWTGKTTLSSSYVPVTTGLPTITVNADFSARTNSRFVCYLIGHEHKDLIGHVTKYADQKIVCLAATAAGNYQNGNSDLPRAANTKAIDCITVFVVDTTTNTVRLVRVGSNVTTELTDRTKFVMN